MIIEKPNAIDPSPIKKEEQQIVAINIKSEKLGKFKDSKGYLPINLPFKSDKKKSKRQNIDVEYE